MDVKLNSYDYSLHKQRRTPGERTTELEQYLIPADCLTTGEKIDYLLNFYRFRDYLYITDIFPRMWENEKDCFKRFTSREGMQVNMRKLSVTSLQIFCNCFLPRDRQAAMVISGSYAPGEKTTGVSRKLRLYAYFFMPLLASMKLRDIQIPALNAFVLVGEDNEIEDEYVIEDYRIFKEGIK